MKNGFSWLLILGLLLAGCDGDGETDGGTDTDAGDVDAGDDVDAGPGSTGDGNDSFAEADPVTLGESVMARIDPAGDLDYFTFEGTAGDWLLVDTDANPDSMDGLLDTVVTLYDASMNIIAENDDGLPRVSPDSELITQLPSTGTYYVLVQEFSTWERAPEPADTPEGMATFVYELLVTTLDDELNQINIDVEPNNDAASAQNMTRQGNFGVLAGSFDSAGDTDVYAFVMGANPNPNFFIMPIGPTGYGAPELPTSIYVTTEDGSDIVARLTPNSDGQFGMFEFDPSLPFGRYNVHVEGNAGSYAIKTFIGGDNPPEEEEMTNGDPATPEMLEFTPVEGMETVERAFVLAQLPAGDTDYFVVNAGAGNVISATCGSRTSGSGIQDLTVELTDTAGMLLAGATATETPTDNAFIEAFMPPAPGEYRVRLTRGAQIADVSGAWVRCGITVGPPAM